MSENSSTLPSFKKSIISSLSEISQEVLKQATFYASSDDQLSTTAPDNTIHFLSPASTTRSECEGDFIYEQFLPKFQDMYETSDLSLLTKSTIYCDERELQRTLAIIKPDAMVFKDVVLRAVKESGFYIVNQRVVHLTAEQAAEIYAHQYGCPSFPNKVVSMSTGPLLVLALAAKNAVDKWKLLIGPHGTIKKEWFIPLSMRFQFGLHVDIPETLHASENYNRALRENRFFFPESVLEPLVSEEDKIKDYCELHVNPTLSRGLAELCRTKPVDPVVFLAEWLLLNNPYQPKLPYNAALATT